MMGATMMCCELRWVGHREHYLNTCGNVRQPKGWQRIKDRFRGMWRGIKKGKIDNFSDHSIGDYVKHIKKFVDGKETPQI